ncbi:SnoaL-like protein [Sinobacterium caligoides]|uniref:SnoaL-like protein n=1 Tax=Sinobacterium caligoides TaxID=933926 RepID=A0A3N2DZ76_9GAMM|nr:nuclear transport factor 2 family protein [Sinobacterium caligoides]ROS04595.1 SnoaL-like protein [Sinobacterium caligoides]
MLDLEAIELIKQLKSRYFRFLDTGDLAGLQTVFTADGGIHYRSPSYEYCKNGWNELEAFFSDSFSKTKFGMHTGHHPEITVTGDTATGIWYLRDTFVSLDDGITFDGSAIYHDVYVKEGGVWKIMKSSYDRLFEQITKRNDDQFITCCPIKG